MLEEQQQVHPLLEEEQEEETKVGDGHPLHTNGGCTCVLTHMVVVVMECMMMVGCIMMVVGIMMMMVVGILMLGCKKARGRFGYVVDGCFGVLGVMSPKMSCCWWRLSDYRIR